MRIRDTMGLPQLFIFLSYFVCSSMYLKTVSPPFRDFVAQEQELEGRFRSSHTNVLNHAEEIAMLQGGLREHTVVDVAYKKILELKEKVLRHRAVMAFLDTTLVKHYGGFLSYEIMIPAMYLGNPKVNLSTVGDRTAYLISAIQYFSGLATALNTLYQNSYQGLSKLAGMSKRVSELTIELKERSGNPTMDSKALASNPYIHFRGGLFTQGEATSAVLC